MYPYIIVKIACFPVAKGHNNFLESDAPPNLTDGLPSIPNLQQKNVKVLMLRLSSFVTLLKIFESVENIFERV